MTVALTNKDYRPLLVALRDQGWELVRTGNGHWKAIPPDEGRKIVMFSESKDWHAFLNTTRDLRDQGLQWPPAKRAVGTVVVDAVAEVVPILRATPFPPTPIEPRSTALLAPASNGAADPDRLWSDLKDAKTYAQLAVEDLGDAQRRLATLQREVDQKRADATSAQEMLRSVKAEFDAAFEVST